MSNYHAKKHKYTDEYAVKTNATGTPLVVQWLRLHFPVQGGTCSIPNGEAKVSHAWRPK